MSKASDEWDRRVAEMEAAAERVAGNARSEPKRPVLRSKHLSTTVSPRLRVLAVDGVTLPLTALESALVVAAFDHFQVHRPAELLADVRAFFSDGTPPNDSQAIAELRRAALRGA